METKTEKAQVRRWMRRDWGLYVTEYAQFPEPRWLGMHDSHLYFVEVSIDGTLRRRRFMTIAQGIQCVMSNTITENAFKIRERTELDEERAYGNK